MSAQILLLAALQNPPREKSFTVAGTHVTNIYGRIQSEPFEFRVLKPELLQGAAPGELLLIEARLLLIEDGKGQLLIIPSAIKRLGHHQPILTSNGYTYATGFQRVTISGNLTGAPQLEDFGKGLYATSFSLELNPNLQNAALDVIVYGESAQALSQRQQGDRYTATGHLKTEKSIDPRGREVVRYTFLPDRADIEDAATFKNRSARRKYDSAPARPDARRPESTPKTKTPQPNQKPARQQAAPKAPATPSAASSALTQEVASLTAAGPKERRQRNPQPDLNPSTQPFTTPVSPETIDLTALAGGVTANLDDLFRTAPESTSTPQPSPATD